MTYHRYHASNEWGEHQMTGWSQVLPKSQLDTMVSHGMARVHKIFHGRQVSLKYLLYQITITATVTFTLWYTSIVSAWQLQLQLMCDIQLTHAQDWVPLWLLLDSGRQTDSLKQSTYFNISPYTIAVD